MDRIGRPNTVSRFVKPKSAYDMILEVVTDFSEDRMGSLVWSDNYTEPFNLKTLQRRASAGNLVR